MQWASGHPRIIIIIVLDLEPHPNPYCTGIWFNQRVRGAMQDWTHGSHSRYHRHGRVSMVRPVRTESVHRPSLSRGLRRKAEPRRQQDWILKCLQGGRARPLAACGVGDAIDN